MPGAHDFLQALAVVFCVAAVTTVLCQRLHQPVVLGYMLAGLIVGPHLPIPLVADVGVVQTLSELGVILLMFSLGLEFSLRKLLALGPTAGITALVQCSLMVWLGWLAGRLLGWTQTESLFAGAIVAISSTTIIAKAFEELGVGGRLRDLVVGILIVEDLIAILLMASLTALSTTRGLSAEALAVAITRLAAFLVGIVAAGLLVVPRAMRLVGRLKRAETTLVASVGFCFAVALLAKEFGYSVALGAFLAGSLIAESGEETRVERLVRPVRDILAAVFFVSVGMLIDPALAREHWLAILVLTAVVVLGKLVTVSVGAFLTGHGTRMSVQAGMSLGQIGEFSFIIAAVGLQLKATGEFLYSVAVAVSAITTLLTPWKIRAAGPFANWVDRKSPKRVQTFAALYGSWLESLRSAPRPVTVKSRVRRLVLLLLLDAALLAAIAAGTAVSLDAAAASLESRAGIDATLARALVIAAAVALGVPFCLGILRVTRRLGETLAERAFPASHGTLDPAAAPRRALVVTVQLVGVVLVVFPLVLLTHPFLPLYAQATFLVIALVVMAFAFWRTAANLHGHARAGAQVIVEALAAQSRAPASTPGEPTLDAVHALLPGLGEPVPVRLTAASPAVDRTLAELNLRGVTGATVLAITRAGEEGVIVPTARERLRAGDVLVLAGTHDAVAAAKDVLRGPEAASAPSSA